MFEGWGEFYLLVGSAAGALIGLLFVVVTLTVGIDNRNERGDRLYMSPTVFHLAAVLAMSAAVLAPRAPASLQGALLTLMAVAGLAYALRNLIGLTQHDDTQHWTDVWFYGAGPFACHLGLAAAAIGVWTSHPEAAYLLAALLVALLLLTIRNAWDLVTYITPRVEQWRHEREPARATEGPQQDTSAG